MAVFQGDATVTRTSGSTTRRFTLRTEDAPSVSPTHRTPWEVKAGDPITLYHHNIPSNPIPAPDADTVILRAYIDTGTAAGDIIIELHNGAPPASGTSYTFYATDDGTATGNPICGPIRLYVRAIRTMLGPYDINSDNESQGAVRAQYVASSMTVNAYPSGDLFAHGPTTDEVITLTATHTPPIQTGYTFLFEIEDTDDFTVVALGTESPENAGAGTTDHDEVVDYTLPKELREYDFIFRPSGDGALFASFTGTAKLWTSRASSGHGTGIVTSALGGTRFTDLFQADPTVTMQSFLYGRSPHDDGRPQVEHFVIDQMVLHAWAVLSNARGEAITGEDVEFQILDNALTAGLQSYYKLDNSVADAHGENDVGIAGTFGTPAKLGTHALDGTSVECSATINIPTGNEFAIQTHIRRTGTETNYGVMREDAGGGPFFLYTDSGTIKVDYENDQGGTTTMTVGAATLDTYVHVVVSYNALSRTLRIWREGALVIDVKDASGTINGNLWTIGDYDGSIANFWEGQIDEISFWSLDLNQTDVDQLYNAGLGRSYDSFIDPINVQKIITDYYNEGVGAANWVPGTGVGPGTQSQEADHLYIEASNHPSILSQRVYVTDALVDLTGVDIIEIEWENTGDDHGNNESYLIASTSKNGLHDVFNARLERRNIFGRTTQTLNVAALTGNHHIRVHARRGHDDASSSKVHVYRVTTIGPDPAGDPADPALYTLDGAGVAGPFQFAATGNPKQQTVRMSYTRGDTTERQWRYYTKSGTTGPRRLMVLAPPVGSSLDSAFNVYARALYAPERIMPLSPAPTYQLWAQDALFAEGVMQSTGDLWKVSLDPDEALYEVAVTAEILDYSMVEAVPMRTQNPIDTHIHNGHWSRKINVRDIEGLNKVEREPSITVVEDTTAIAAHGTREAAIREFGVRPIMVSARTARILATKKDPVRQITGRRTSQGTLFPGNLVKFKHRPTETLIVRSAEIVAPGEQELVLETQHSALREMLRSRTARLRRMVRFRL